MSAQPPPARRLVLPLPSLRVWLIIFVVIGFVAAGILLWQNQPAWLAGTGESDSPLASFCAEQRVPCPMEGSLALPAELSAISTTAELANSLTSVLKERGELYRPDSPPDRLRSASEVLVGKDLKLVPLEAVSVGWAMAQAANLTVSPCLPESQPVAEPFWQRGYALCDEACKLIYSPLPQTDREITWKCLSGPHFTAYFIAATGELPLPAKEAYRLFAAARELDTGPDLKLHLGAVKVRNNAPEFGIEDMRSALQSGASPDGQLLLGDALLSVGLPADALDAFETLLRVAPDDANGRLGKARALGLLGRAEDASATLKSLEESNPDLPGLWAAIALTRRQSKDIAGATAAMHREVDGNPAREHVAVLVDLLLEQKQEEEAMRLLDSLYEQHHRADLALLAVQLTEAIGGEDESRERLSVALTEHPDNVELLYLSAQRLLEAKDFEAAEEALMRLRQRDPENPQVMIDLALSRFGLEKSGGHGAKSARDTVKELRKQWPRRFYQVAQVLSSWKYWDETEKLIEDQLEERPGSRRLTAWLYFFYLSHDKAEKARALRERQHPALDSEDIEWLKKAYERIDARVANERSTKDD